MEPTITAFLLVIASGIFSPQVTVKSWTLGLLITEITLQWTPEAAREPSGRNCLEHARIIYFYQKGNQYFSSLSNPKSFLFSIKIFKLIDGKEPERTMLFAIWFYGRGASFPCHILRSPHPSKQSLRLPVCSSINLSRQPIIPPH